MRSDDGGNASRHVKYANEDDGECGERGNGSDSGANAVRIQRQQKGAEEDGEQSLRKDPKGPIDGTKYGNEHGADGVAETREEPHSVANGVVSGDHVDFIIVRLEVVCIENEGGSSYEDHADEGEGDAP